MVDGFGLAMMMRLYGKTVQRWPGIDMAKEVLTIAKEKNWRVAFLGGENNIVAQAKNQIESELNMSIYAEQGGKVDKLGDDDEAGEEARHRLTLFDPEVLLVAFGHPKQEMWIAKQAQEFPNLKVIIGIGGSFDIWGKKLKRAPKWMRLIGLEWVWRLVQQPSRIGRIVNAVIVFPVLFITDQWKAKKSENKKSKQENDIKERLR
jgi:N-acetylglucosaminyldiphosphoundecaprenol N-acetyl-beta-D-mannosaminyltransferase